MDFSFLEQEQTKPEAFVLCVYTENEFALQSREKAQALGVDLIWHIEGSKNFKGKNGQTLVVPASKESGVRYLVLLGMGDLEGLTALACEKAADSLYKTLASLGLETAAIKMEEAGESPVYAAHMALGIKLAAYRFDRYKEKEEEALPLLSSVEFLLSESEQAKTLYDTMDCVAEGTLWARDLVNEPANKIYPESFVERLKEELSPLGVEIDVLDEKKMEKLGMEAFLSVGQGSARPPRLAVMKWKGGGDVEPLSFVGKGITFDTGGVNIKPTGEYLSIMKIDMGGAATIAGMMKALALRKAKVNVIGAVALAENMVSSRASRPGDIVRSMSGKTIEIVNTDAEGRLVLADTVTYVQKTYDPSLLIDVATLTGAIMAALGNDYAGLFTNDQALWEKLEQASAVSGEKLWRMPLDEVFSKDVKADIADLKNLGGMGSHAGACTAAAFIQAFVDKNLPWAHMDIAGAAWKKFHRPTTPKGATGYGVRLLNDFIAQHYEDGEA